MRRILAVATLCMLGAVSAFGQGNIVYMEQGPADAHVTDWTNLLTGAGYTVTQVYNYPDITGADAGRLGELQSADLVIMGRHTNSGNYDDSPEEIAAWNALTTPILAMGPHNLRDNRLKWFAANSLTAGQVSCEAVIPSHPIFTGVTLGANNRVVISNATGTDYTTEPVGNGQLIGAVVDGTGTTTFPYICYWDGSQPFYAGGQTPAAKRLVFFGGGGITDGDFDLTADGSQLFLNAIEFLITGTVGGGGGGGEGEGEGEGEPQGNVIVSNVYPPYIDEGTLVILTAPAGTGYVWKKDGAVVPGETERELVFSPITLADAGTYIAEYDDGLKAAQTTPAFNLTVQAEGSVPAAGLLGLLALAGACGLGGSRLIRRRK